jgi:methyl-accepting chemotaxis protein
MAVLSTLNPGVQECQKTIEIIQNAISDLDSAAIALTVGQLQVKLPPNKTPQQIQSDLLDIMKELAEDIRTLQSGVMGSSVDMVEGAKQLQSKVPLIVKIAKAIVHCDPNQQHQQEILALNKQVVEGVLHTVRACIETANSQTQENIDKLQKTTNSANQSIAQLLNALQSKTTLVNDISQSINSINNLSKTVDEPLTEFAGAYWRFCDPSFFFAFVCACFYRT